LLPRALGGNTALTSDGDIAERFRAVVEASTRKRVAAAVTLRVHWEGVLKILLGFSFRDERAIYS
jgi:hypothetical protein